MKSWFDTLTTPLVEALKKFNPPKDEDFEEKLTNVNTLAHACYKSDPTERDAWDLGEKAGEKFV